MPCNALFELPMKCQEFAQIVVELARGRMMDATQRAQGLAHIAECASCAARLSDECALTAGLSALAASEIKLSAPANTEATLLAAFRQKAAPPIITAQVTTSRRWPRWAWATAAAILIALTFIALRAWQAQTPHGNIAVLPSPTPISTPVIEPHVSPSLHQVGTKDELAARRAQRWVQPVSYRRPIIQHSQRPQHFLIKDALTVFAGDSEVKSDFVPLTYGAQAPPLESGQLIRVQMPRAALAAYGLPVNVERADTPVKAELLVSEDGRAHAIRFVR